MNKIINILVCMIIKEVKEKWNTLRNMWLKNKLRSVESETSTHFSFASKSVYSCIYLSKNTSLGFNKLWLKYQRIFFLTKIFIQN